MKRRLSLIQKYWTPIQKKWDYFFPEDSFMGWIGEILLAFIIIKFLVYPVIGLILGTNFPIVAVVSGSMEHKVVHPPIYDSKGHIIGHNTAIYEMCGNQYSKKISVDLDTYFNECGGFYSKLNISKKTFQTFPFKNGFNTGDIMVLWGKKPEKIKQGDILVFWGDRSDPIIHRVVEISKDNEEIYIHTKGDHNSASFPFEKKIPLERVVGYQKHQKASVAILRIPYLGYVKIIFVKILLVIRALFGG